MIMKCIRPNFVPTAFVLLLPLALAAEPALAQNKMRAEDEALYKNMMKAADVDRGAANDAAKSNAAARRWTDSLVIDLKWKLAESTLAGRPTFRTRSPK